MKLAFLPDPTGNCWHQPWRLGEGSISVEHCGHFGQAYLCFPLAGKFVCRECIVEILGLVKRVQDLSKWLVTRNMLWLMRKSSWIQRSTNSDTPSWSPSTRCGKNGIIFNLASVLWSLIYLPVCWLPDWLPYAGRWVAEGSRDLSRRGLVYALVSSCQGEPSLSRCLWEFSKETFF